MPDRYAAQRATFPKGATARSTRPLAYDDGEGHRAFYPGGEWARVDGYRDDGLAFFRFKDSGIVTFPYDDVNDVPMEVVEHPEQAKLDALKEHVFRLHFAGDLAIEWLNDHRDVPGSDHIAQVLDVALKSLPNLAKRD
jgi:hypothetical protein